MLIMPPVSFEHKVMALATASATMESSSSLIQSESRVQRSYQEVQVSEQRTVKKKTKSRRHKDEGTISVSKSSEKLFKKMKAATDTDSIPQCEKCSRPVYAMERIKAEKRIWHKECFRCIQCNKQLTVETYQSDHTTLYCKPHFKHLFEPKPVDDDDVTDASVPKKHQMIICESNPIELPPDVVRASDKPDLGLEELSQLDVKSRFEVFERKANAHEEPLPQEPRAPREKTAAILSKLAKFKAKGMDVGVSDEYLNGVPVEQSSSEPEDDEDDEDSVLKKSYKHTATREQPVSFCNMSEIVGKFETGQHSSSERHRERKQEIQNIRSRLFMGKQAKIKEMYEQSVLQSEQDTTYNTDMAPKMEGVTSSDKISREMDVNAEKARAIKERFENGEVFNDENQPPRNREINDMAMFNEGVCNFNGKHGCLKCTVVGEYSHQSNTVIFPKTDCPKRNNDDFRSKMYGQHHKYDTPLLELPIDMIEDFPVGDSLHLIDLGIMKRLLTGWRDGNFGKKTTKWCARDIVKFSQFMTSCRLPKEIHRSVRTIDVLAHWKASEFRTFLYYLSLIILKDLLSPDAYHHFLLFFCAITIFSNDKHFAFLRLGDTLLKAFVENYCKYYGKEYLTSNVHNLIHVIDEVKRFGILQSFNAYPFENKLYCIKRMVRHGNQTLSQIARRLIEKNNIELESYDDNENKIPFIRKCRSKNGFISNLYLKNFVLSTQTQDKWFLTTSEHVVEILFIYYDKKGNIEIRGNSFNDLSDVFETPIKSSFLNIYKISNFNVQNNSECLYTVNDIKCKLVSVTYENTVFFIPLLHTL